MMELLAKLKKAYFLNTVMELNRLVIVFSIPLTVMDETLPF